jgi:hypothetical protein
MGDRHLGGDRPGLDEIYCGPMEDVTIGVVLAYGERKGEMVYETAKAGALAFNYNVPVVSGNPTVGHPLAMLGDCGAVLEAMGLLGTENVL